MWISFKKLGKPVLSNVQKIAIETLEDGSAGIVDLDVENSVNLFSGLTTDIISEIKEEEYDELNQDPRVMLTRNSGELGWYNNYERAKEIFDEIQRAIIAGETFYKMPEE